MDWPAICLNIVFEMMYSSREWGFLFNNSGLGYSVARARDANVSMIKLTQSIWIGFSISFWIMPAPTKVMITATTFTVSWNWMNFLIESYMLRPHRTALMIEEKLSSMRVIEAASRATSVPEMPIANPTSAFLRAGASLVPSPVTATTLPLSLRAVTKQYLS